MPARQTFVSATGLSTLSSAVIPGSSTGPYDQGHHLGELVLRSEWKWREALTRGRRGRGCGAERKSGCGDLCISGRDGTSRCETCPALNGLIHKQPCQPCLVMQFTNPRHSLVLVVFSASSVPVSDQRSDRTLRAHCLRNVRTTIVKRLGIAGWKRWRERSTRHWWLHAVSDGGPGWRAGGM